MPGPDAAPDDREARRARMHRDLVMLLQQLSVESNQIAQAFAAGQGLHSTDVHALLHVMRAETTGGPLTTGRLAEALGLSSGATTAVVDRLERDGHLRRDRDAHDRRRIHLLHGEHGREVAQQFFGPLGRLSSAIMDDFSDDELQTVRAFLTRMTAAMAEHHASLAAGPAPSAVGAAHPVRPADPRD